MQRRRAQIRLAPVAVLHVAVAELGHARRQFAHARSTLGDPVDVVVGAVVAAAAAVHHRSDVRLATVRRVAVAVLLPRLAHVRRALAVEAGHLRGPGLQRTHVAAAPAVVHVVVRVHLAPGLGLGVAVGVRRVARPDPAGAVQTVTQRVDRVARRPACPAVLRRVQRRLASVVPLRRVAVSPLRRVGRGIRVRVGVDELALLHRAVVTAALLRRVRQVARRAHARIASPLGQRVRHALAFAQLRPRETLLLLGLDIPSFLHVRGHVGLDPIGRRVRFGRLILRLDHIGCRAAGSSEAAVLRRRSKGSLSLSVQHAADRSEDGNHPPGRSRDVRTCECHACCPVG